MANLNELHVPEPGDDAAIWAAVREFEMRERRYRVARLGLAGAIRNLTAAVRHFDEAFQGVK